MLLKYLYELGIEGHAADLKNNAGGGIVVVPYDGNFKYRPSIILDLFIRTRVAVASLQRS